MAFTRTEQRRITFLSLLSSATNIEAEAGEQLSYDLALRWLESMESDGFFDEETSRPNPTSQRSAASFDRASDSRPSSGSRGRDQDRPAFSGQYRDPDGPPTEKQVDAVLKMSDDYSRSELNGMTKAEVGALISDLKG